MELPAHLELASAWREISTELRRVVGESTYEIWLAPLEVKAWDGAELLLQAPPATQAWVAKRFGGVLENCAQAVVGSAARVSFAAAGEGTRTDRRSRARPGDSESPATTSGLNPRYSFDQFIIGDGNRLAHAASLAVAELPGQAYNPLFLHAPPGLGKTHLLHAIGNYVLNFGGGASVRYTTVEAFTNHFITALGSRSLDHFKHAYRDADVLLIDDVQFLASKAKTEEEFFHTFNALYENGRQLVLTCDRLPRQLVGVEERLRERFESGLVADIAPPDFATRVAILRKRAALDAIGISDVSVLELIAERVTDNVRALEGALIRIVAHHSLTNRPLDVELARTVLDGMHPSVGAGTLSIEKIQSCVASYYEVTVDELVSPSRAARVAWPRQVAIHLTRELTTASLQGIGDAFGGRNHATVLHACKRVSQRMMETPETTNDIRELTATIARGEADRDC
ncbi:MAG: chromosomal replication initiator protein [Solirubrobacteraceae bacterium]|nr:chromosomal replication initiator protein [Solirubrobacteraceae bacterium]